MYCWNASQNIHRYNYIIIPHPSGSENNARQNFAGSYDVQKDAALGSSATTYHHGFKQVSPPAAPAMFSYVFHMGFNAGYAPI